MGWTSKPVKLAPVRSFVSTVRCWSTPWFGLLGPEHLYDGKQIIRAGLKDHFGGKLLGLPMGCDACYTNHAEADQNDIDVLLTPQGAVACTFVMGIRARLTSC